MFAGSILKMQRVSMPLEMRQSWDLVPTAGKKRDVFWATCIDQKLRPQPITLNGLHHILERDAAFDLIIGKWGENAGPNDRQAVSVAFKVTDTGPAFMVQDASVRSVRTGSLVSRALNRAEVVGQPIAADVFQICDSIYLADPRIDELRA